MKSIVVAKYQESIEWMLKLKGFACFIYDKSDGTIPNVGREAHTYLLHIVNNYDELEGETVFCQGNPFDHDRDFIAHLGDEKVRHYGAVSGCPSSGAPHMGDASLDDYCRVLGLPIQAEYKFVAGAQYRLTREQILSRPLAFYECLLSLTKLENKSPWSLERLWPLIWGIELE